MEEKNASTLFEEMKDDVSSYVRNTAKLIKFEAYEKSATGSSIAAYSLILLFVFLFTLLLISVTAGLFLGELLQSMWMGFGIVSLFNVFILLAIILFRKKIKNGLTNKIIKFLLESDEEKK